VLQAGKSRVPDPMRCQSHFKVDSQSVRLGVEPALWAFDQILLLIKDLGLKFVVLSLFFNLRNPSGHTMP
jgi:hypothetical protein